MAVRIVQHIIDTQRAIEIVDLADDHGRKHQIQAGILPGHPDTESFIQGQIEQFAEQERLISEHIARRFDPETRERKK